VNTNIMSEIKKVVLAYSGGLDTSVILKWLQDTYQCEIVTFTADLGQGEELEPARTKALQFGIKPENIFIDDLREEFVRDFVFPMFRANTVYEGEYLLGTSIARPLIAKRQIEIARQVKADSVSHGATGKGNDQVRFELGYYALEPGIKVIAPWREWDLLSREKLLAYAEKHGIPVEMKHKQGGAPYSMDANLLHISFEGRHLENPNAEAEESMWRWTVSPENAPDAAEIIEIEFRSGDPVAINGKAMKPHELLAELNTLGGKHGIGRLDLVENRFVGMKSRGCYETPGGTILLKAHRGIESITLDREVAHLKDDLMPRYASLIYNGYWWSPERLALQTLIDHTQTSVNGVVRLKLYKGSVAVISRDSANTLFDQNIATFDDDGGAYNQADAGGFIKLNALRMRIAEIAKRKRTAK
jgi:argininosuccinate synthase